MKENEEYLMRHGMLMPLSFVMRFDLAASSEIDKYEQFKTWVGKCYKEVDKDEPNEHPHFYYIWSIDENTGLPLILELAYDYADKEFYVCRSNQSFDPESSMYDNCVLYNITKEEFDSAYAEVQRRIKKAMGI